MLKKKRIQVFLPLKLYNMVKALSVLYADENNPQGNMSETIRHILEEFYLSETHKKWLEKIARLTYEALMKEIERKAITKGKESP